MFAIKMYLGLLALLCSSTLASQPAQHLKKGVANASHKQELIKVPPAEHSKNETSHLRKGASPKTHSTKKQKEDANAVRGLVEGLSAVPTKGGKVVPGFANKVNHPSVRALQPKSQHTKPEEHKTIAKAKPVKAEEKPRTQEKTVAHQPKVSKPKAVEANKKKQETTKAEVHHPALVARTHAYPSLVPQPARIKNLPGFHASASMTEEERAKKVQHAMDVSEEAVQSVDQDVEEAKKEAVEAHQIAHGK
eukprot:gnl/MRDRNA2_/MRDRNA2_89042_c0_seq1.p1 gnl/MRDRNA2_/MRDRNA2_89042_c0~~gnl/MRDRNA2_/MRDRNA2_89042_c0_seq1.p1  ORF type:complete len:249 (+),score=69.85 gnl/MRDRNA2_/MRDRNA2_89042_c0_seq1:66-812(+)